MMSAVTKVLADHNANIRYVDLHSAGDRADIYFEFTLEEPPDTLFQDLKRLDGVLALEEIPSFAKIYGKRIIVMGGGAQVGPGRARRHRRGRSPQHPRRAHLGRHHPARRRAGARGGVRARRAAAARQAARAGRLADGRRHLAGRRGSAAERAAS